MWVSLTSLISIHSLQQKQQKHNIATRLTNLSLSHHETVHQRAFTKTLSALYMCDNPRVVHMSNNPSTPFMCTNPSTLESKGYLSFLHSCIHTSALLRLRSIPVGSKPFPHPILQGAARIGQGQGFLRHDWPVSGSEAPAVG